MKNDIDVGLAVLCSLMKTGDNLSDRDIAYVCNCSRNAIYIIEKRALRKLRVKLSGFEF